LSDAPSDARGGARRGRGAIAAARRIVVKIGSKTLAADPSVYGRIAASFASARASRRTLVLVSSGAIALGTKKLAYRARPKEMARLQAAAAAGQSVLMRAYEESFAAHGLAVAQVLLTHADLADRTRANNARAALGALIDAGCVPILNENDSVSVEEIKFGDNDQLAAMVAPLVDADLLILLSDVEGLLDGDGQRISVVHRAEDAKRFVRASRSDVGSGGMLSKVEAARRATLAGANVVVADARGEDTLDRVLAGDDVGTFFAADPDRLSARRHWIAFTLRPRGDIVLDAGAAEAVRGKGRSVLPVGVLGVRGVFESGDAVRVLDPSGAEIGRGLARCAAAEAARVAGKGKAELASDGAAVAEIVHRDDFVVWRGAP
jgi:glutamate 5-kinase